MSGPSRQAGPPDQAASWFMHDAAIGGGAGLVVGFVAGVFVMARLVDTLLAPFLLAAAGACLGAVLLVRSGRDRTGFTAPRLLAWVLFGAGAGFLWVLYRALDDFA